MWDVICVAVGLRPLSELAQMAGVQHDFIPEMGGWMPLHNMDMETSVPGIYVAGEYGRGRGGKHSHG